MIAEAVKAAYPDARSVSVDLATIRFSDPTQGLRYTYLTPRIAQVELVMFDRGTKPEPFQFQLRNGMVTMAGTRRPPKKPSTKEAREILGRNFEKAAKVSPTRRAAVVRGENDKVTPDRIGGSTPPLQKGARDDVPFSRRRAFGLRGLEL
jgi:hypothetical protein